MRRDQLDEGPLSCVEDGLARIDWLRQLAYEASENWEHWCHLVWAIDDLLRWDWWLIDRMPTREEGRRLSSEERKELCGEQVRALRLAGFMERDLALALWRQGDVAQARKQFNRAVHLRGEPGSWDAGLFAAWGTFLCDQGDREAGLEQLRAAVQLAPEHAAYWARLGIFAQGQEQVDGFRTAARLAPQHDCLHEQASLSSLDQAAEQQAETHPSAPEADHTIRHRHFLWPTHQPLQAAEDEAVLRAWLQHAPADRACAEDLYRSLSHQLEWTGTYCGGAEGWEEPLWGDPEGRNGGVPSQPYVDLGRSLVCLGRPDQAEHVLRRALTVHPDDPAVLTELAGVARAQGRGANAEEHLRAALAHGPVRGPDISHRHRLLGEALLFQDRPAAAAVVLRRATALDPLNAAAYTTLAEALEALRLFEEAVTAARRGVVLAPDQGWGAGVLGRILLGRADIAGAREALEGAARLSPDSAVIQEDLAQLWRLAGPDAPAGAGLAAARRCVELGPDRLSGYAALAAALHDLGLRAEALQVSADAVKRWPASGRAHNLHALALWETGDQVGALAAASEASHLERSAIHLHNWGWLLTRTGRPEQALPLYEAAQDKDPYDPHISHGFALANLLAGRPGAARVHFERSIAHRADRRTAGRAHLYLSALGGWDTDRHSHLISARWAHSHPGERDAWPGPADRVRAQALTAEIANHCLSSLDSISGSLAERIASDPEQPALQWAAQRLTLRVQLSLRAQNRLLKALR